jgi:hypothetical protein
MKDNITTSFGPNNVSDQNIKPRVKDFYDCAQEVHQLKKNLEDAQERKDQAEEILVQTFEDAGISMVKTEEGSFFFRFEFYASIEAAKKSEGLDWVRELGHEDLIKESIHAQIFSSFIKELMAEDENIELPEFVSTHTKKRIGYRKK